jgi:hypothetical protein
MNCRVYARPTPALSPGERNFVGLVSFSTLFDSIQRRQFIGFMPLFLKPGSPYVGCYRNFLRAIFGGFGLT